MNNNKLFSFIMILIGVTMIFLGTRWLIVEDPWMLDEVANVERLGMTFDELFELEINNSLPGYLRQIYRFFGLWVSIIGFFIISFSTPSMIIQNTVRKRVLFCFGIMMIMGTILDELERRDLSTGLVTLCVGAGMGTATIIERL